MTSTPIQTVSNINELFQNHTIEEIKIIERQFRGEIEKKKEELRIMVGERYRDLINAADTIQDMKNSTNEIFAGIASISDLCSSFSLKSSDKDKINEKSSKNEGFYTLATQMDLLVDTPEKIWSALDTQQYLLACQYYLLSQHIVNGNLNIDAGLSSKRDSRDVYASFPILHHQWAAISHFKPSILKGSIASLKDPLLPDKLVAENLCAISLLDNYSPRQVFTEFLIARKTALQDIFHPSFHAKSVKAQICDVVYLLQLTIKQIVALFYTDEAGNGETKPLFYQILSELTDENKVTRGQVFQDLYGEDMGNIPVTKYLPESVRGFIPKLRIVPVSISISYIQKHVVEWINGCMNDVKKGVAHLLTYVDNVKALSLIRDAVYVLLKEQNQADDPNDEDEEKKSLLNQCCQIALNRSLNIWSEFLQDLFFQRAKDIVEKHMNLCFGDVTTSFNNTLSNLTDIKGIEETCWDQDLTTYLWNEFPQELPMLSSCDPSVNDIDSILSLKAKGYTPAIKCLCQDFNKNLQTLLNDTRYFVYEVETTPLDEKQEKLNRITKDVQKLLYDGEEHEGTFNKFADNSKMKEFLIQHFHVKVVELCQHFAKVLDILKGELSNTRETHEMTKLLNKVTFLARFVLSVPELCYNIRNVTDFNLDQLNPFSRQLSRTKSGHNFRQNQKIKQSEAYMKIEAEFNQQTQYGFKIWCSNVGQICIESVTDIFNSEKDFELLSLTNWENIEIDEENEKGEQMKTMIRVPAQISFYLSNLLFRLSEEFHRSGGYLVDRSTLSSMMLSMCRSILKNQFNIIRKDQNIFQNRVLQMLFDVKFLLKLFCSNSTSKEMESEDVRNDGQKLLKTLEQKVDPFDLDVFLPHMELFIQRQISRSWLIYGCLAAEKQTMHLQQLLTHTQEQHSIVQLVANPPRFMLLPISGYSSYDEKHTGYQEELPSSVMDQSVSPLYRCQWQLTS